MSDDIDRAQNEVERNLAEALRSRKPAGPVANGRCYYCGELLDDVSRWCGARCRDDWEKLTRRRR